MIRDTKRVAPRLESVSERRKDREMLEELGHRWESQAGKRALEDAIEMLKRGANWTHPLQGLPHVETVTNGRDLRAIKLSNVMLSSGDLADADLRFASLTNCEFSKVNFEGTNLHATRSRRTLFYECNMRRINLDQASAFQCILAMSDLSDATMVESFLIGCDLHSANLSHVNATSARLLRSRLDSAILDGATLTAANLFATVRDGWSIDGVECAYVYWDKDGRQRSPKGRDLVSGEFERLYASLPTIEYVFEHGMSPIDPLIMDRVVQTIRERSPEFDMRIATIEARGLNPSITFTVLNEEQKEPALAAVTDQYEAKIKQLSVERDRLYALISEAIDSPRYVKLIRYSSCFISYAEEDREMADRLHEDLVASGIPCWYFPASARSGRTVWDEIDNAIRNYDRLIIILSQSSLRSQGVIREFRRGLRQESDTGRRVVFPVRIDDAVLTWKHELAIDLQEVVVADFTNWRSKAKYHVAFTRLLADLMV